MPASSDTKANLLDAVLASTREQAAARQTRLQTFLRLRDPWQALVVWLGLGPGDAAPRREDITARLTFDLAALDIRLARQCNAILHAPELQRLEATWRGVAYLVDQATAADGVLIRLFDVNWRTLVKDLERAIEFDQSVLFRRIYSDEFGTPGGQPFGLLLGDYYIGHRPRPDQPVDDTRTLRGIAQVA
ncbi:MAG: type VI secretion system contractile sheath large subunit, partial [Planctomycetes bacterium]|nr:type VI secretion system contractile sheath large subunit [Planctomycetota bacterium]